MKGKFNLANGNCLFRSLFKCYCSKILRLNGWNIDKKKSAFALLLPAADRFWIHNSVIYGRRLKAVTVACGRSLRCLCYWVVFLPACIFLPYFPRAGGVVSNHISHWKSILKGGWVIEYCLVQLVWPNWFHGNVLKQSEMLNSLVVIFLG